MAADGFSFVGVRTGHLLQHKPDNMLAQGGRKFSVTGLYCFGTPGAFVACCESGGGEASAYVDALRSSMPQKKFVVEELTCTTNHSKNPFGNEYSECSSLGELRTRMAEVGLGDDAFSQLTGMEPKVSSSQSSGGDGNGGGGAGQKGKKGKGGKKGGKRR
jgi:hypothetical protein